VPAGAAESLEPPKEGKTKEGGAEAHPPVLAEQRLRVALDKTLERVTAVCPFKKSARIQSKTAAGDLRDGAHRQAAVWDERHTDDAFVPDGGDLNHGAVVERSDQRDNAVNGEVDRVDRASRFEQHRLYRKSDAADNLEQLHPVGRR